jgi:hypothetical protein
VSVSKASDDRLEDCGTSFCAAIRRIPLVNGHIAESALSFSNDQSFENGGQGRG